MIEGFDHIALPTADPERFLRFYKALGFTSPDEDAWRSGTAPIFSVSTGDNKINVHPPGFVTTLRGRSASPGCGDLCFRWGGSPADALARVNEVGARLLHGPVPRVGGRGTGTAPGTSVYLRDPDGNLLEIIWYEHDARWSGSGGCA